MNKFKVGDKVKVVENSAETTVGEYKTILNIDSTGKIQVSLNGTYFFTSRFERVERIPQVGDIILYDGRDPVEIVSIKSDLIGRFRADRTHITITNVINVKDSDNLTFDDIWKLPNVHLSNKLFYTWEDGTPIFPREYRKEIPFIDSRVGSKKSFIVTKGKVQLYSHSKNQPMVIPNNTLIELLEAMKEADKS